LGIGNEVGQIEKTFRDIAVNENCYHLHLMWKTEKYIKTRSITIYRTVAQWSNI
jgi:hypothetical protein